MIALATALARRTTATKPAGCGERRRPPMPGEQPGRRAARSGAKRTAQQHHEDVDEQRQHREITGPLVYAAERSGVARRDHQHRLMGVARAGGSASATTRRSPHQEQEQRGAPDVVLDPVHRNAPHRQGSGPFRPAQSIVEPRAPSSAVASHHALPTTTIRRGVDRQRLRRPRRAPAVLIVHRYLPHGKHRRYRHFPVADHAVEVCRAPQRREWCRQDADHEHWRVRQHGRA